ncbi:TetR/AcrR family transcriptional regulator [Rhodococcus sp. BP-252]|uniref:TetR/AcrR family transcriptional regulator n=1 Tax=unclassified Rhodococcus (in: high G+C Gram-positive bacteria) TaxID=192944 RepID=UPI000DF1FF80|nr:MULTISPECIES: TetR/AcrR family transcriptional regulator [unclassified Rhodococcus (in: high G+C Gram-positive bacteria)]MBY6411612.1 TetR/AcrR family transcriptional regulator [Rhodococcus sp. BP-320]MBY6419793.1 TetR/AcrR family transcriptional regulator [Rhodococcus sp. BP-321]MBY6424750.1 TetR/AcrR family transcriptional regulator [Rhodococcus sp. BP-324]MBY6427792.1 TetR/AcrR family transcriptional regulator [Rhodococcus sp. BP-323]MBY6432989.1 TetR/AcrR family transcriptional regulato
MASVNNAVVKRTRMSPEERRAQLISLGTEMLSERPLEQVSVEDIADQAGVSRGLLFHYFSSKQDFHLAIVREASREMLERTAPDTSLEPYEILRDSIANYVDYVTENRETFISLLRGSATGDPDMRAVFEETRSAMAERTVANLYKLDVDANPTTELAVRGWIAFVEEATISWLQDPKITRDELIDLEVGALPAVALAPTMIATLLGAGS